MAITRIGNPALANVREPNFRNIIINGDMTVSQRGTSTASITSTGYHTLDRFETLISSLGTWTQSQSTTVPSGQGFAKSLKMDNTTADASPGSGDYCIVRTKFEGQNLQYLKKGTSSAQSLTLSFWVRSNKTGTYIAELYDNDNTRQISKSYTISSADTWEKKTVTFAGDTTGAFDNDNALSLSVNFWLGAGTDFTSGTLSTSWSSVTAANRAVGQVNLADNTANEWYITGVQLEAGTTASDFEFLPHDVNLARCQRYFQFIGGVQNANQSSGSSTGSTTSVFTIHYQTTMRSAPTHSFSDMKITDDVNYDKTISAIAASNSSIYSARVFYTHASGATQYRPASLQPVSTSSTSGITLSAEL